MIAKRYPQALVCIAITTNIESGKKLTYAEFIPDREELLFKFSTIMVCLPRLLVLLSAFKAAF